MLEALWQVSLGISAIILFLLLLTPLLKKRYSAKWRYILWLILAIRLIIPIHFPFPNSLIQIEIPAVSVMNPLPSPQSTQIINSNVDKSTRVVSTLKSDSGTSNIESAYWNIQAWYPILFYGGWLTGTMLFLFCYGGSYMIFLNKIRACCIPAEIKLGKPAVFYCSMISTPMLVGFFKPRILLPKQEYKEQELQMTLLHELTHYRRHDLWYKLILVFANAFHWFNPFIWYMVHCANQDLEFSCDDIVTKNMDLESKKIYSTVLLNAAVCSVGKRTALSTCFSEGKKKIKNRFQNIFSQSPKKKGIFSGIIVICLAIAAGSLFSIHAGEPGSNQNITNYKVKNEYILDYGNLEVKYKLKEYQSIGLSDEKMFLNEFMSDFSYLRNCTAHFEKAIKPYGIVIKIGETAFSIKGSLELQFQIHAFLLFFAIDDLDYVTYEMPDQTTYRYKRDDSPLSDSKDPIELCNLFINILYGGDQEKADRKEELWCLDPEKVAYRALLHDNMEKVRFLTSLQLKERDEANCVYTLTYDYPYRSDNYNDNLKVTMDIVLRQPFSIGEKGIWVVTKINSYSTKVN
jgi:beta-lactamase regulating signal transducer with metallopeptidase domain